MSKQNKVSISCFNSSVRLTVVISHLLRCALIEMNSLPSETKIKRNKVSFLVLTVQ